MTVLMRPVFLLMAGLVNVFHNPTLAWAQDTPSLPEVRVQSSAPADTNANISGWENTPAWQVPVQTLHFQTQVLENAQVQRLADVVKLDASITDAYNTSGYWDFLSIRGFTLDNASNYRREGLPINAETRIGLANKSSIELLKGTSGLQAGVSAPGGLVNYVVKRPDGDIQQAELALTGGNSVKTALDLSKRFGENKQFGWRVSGSSERLDPSIQANQGHHHLFALALQWQPVPNSSLDFEFEQSGQRQTSVPGLSAFASTLPNANSIDPATNVNQQPWTLPVDMQGKTGSIRWQQQLNAQWRTQWQYGEQHLRTDDRTAFPFGCEAESLYDRFCSNGTADLYDFRSDNERRVTKALQAQFMGKLQSGQVIHDVQWGALKHTHQTDVSTQLFNYPPVGVIDVTAPATALPADASAPGFVVADRTERSTELWLADSMTFNNQWRAWLGVRHTHQYRQSRPTDGSASTQYSQNITTPWVGIGYTFAPQTQAYMSWGEGAEVLTAPLSSPTQAVTNSGQIMPAAKSRQFEVGVKSIMGTQQWGINAFHIHRPRLAVVDAAYQIDGAWVHQGLEGQWQLRQGPWQIDASAMVIRAQQQGGGNALNGLTPTNVPHYTLKSSASYQLPTAVTAGLRTTAHVAVVNEGARWADPANTLRVPAWTRLDANVEVLHKASNHAVTWRLGVNNALNSRAWRESPNLFGHIWLFPLPERQWTLSAKLDF